MNELALFAGAGGGILGGHLLGWRTVCAVEWDAYAASVLVQRQNDGCLPPFAIWDDVQTFDGRAWRGRVDVISGGFPCTDISCAGKGAGIDGKQSSMWGHMARIVGEVQPRFVFVENSPMLVGRGLARVLGDLAALGYDAKWGVLGAHHVAAPHRRDRIWIVADSNECRAAAVSNGKQSRRAQSRSISANVADSHGSRSRENLKPSELRTERAFQSPGDSGETDQAKRGEKQKRAEAISDANSAGLQGRIQDGVDNKERRQKQSQGPVAECGVERKRDRDMPRWIAESDLGRELPARMANRVDINGTFVREGISRVGKGIPYRIGRLKCIGNGQVPQCAALAWQILSGQNYEHIQPAEHRPD